MEKIFDSELNVLKILWDQGDITAKSIAEILEKKVGWHANTTYTVINKCIAKGYIERIYPKFICHVLISEQEALSLETNDIADKFFDGSVSRMFVALAEKVKLTEEMKEELLNIINKEE